MRYINDIKKVEKASNIKDIDINKNIDTETTSNVGKDGSSKSSSNFLLIFIFKNIGRIYVKF